MFLLLRLPLPALPFSSPPRLPVYSPPCYLDPGCRLVRYPKCPPFQTPPPIPVFVPSYNSRFGARSTGSEFLRVFIRISYAEGLSQSKALSFSRLKDTSTSLEKKASPCRIRVLVPPHFSPMIGRSSRSFLAFSYSGEFF